MNTGMKRQWWRGAVAVLVGGAVVGGGWVGLTRFASANPAPVPAAATPPADAATWSRATSQRAAAPTIEPVNLVIQAVALLPEMPAVAPAPPTTAVVPAPLPAAPQFRPVAVPAVPPPDATALPALPTLPIVPAAPALTLPALPAESAGPVKLVPAAEPDFNLRPGSGGNTVKTDVPVAPPVPVTPPAVPVIPVVTEPNLTPPARVTDRAKPADGPFSASEKYVFPLPEKPPVAVTLPPVMPDRTPATPASRPGATAVPTPLAPAVPPVGTGIAAPTATAPDTPALPPGDRTMTLKPSAIAAVIGGALAFAPAPPAQALTVSPGAVAAVPPPPMPIGPATTPFAATSPVAADPVKDKTTDERLGEIQRDLRRLTELLNGRKDETGTTLPSDVGLVEEMKRLRDKVDGLQKQLDVLKNSTSLRPATTPAPTPTTSPAADTLVGRGTVRVVNDYPVEITIVVNNNSYRVAANTKLDVTVPTGEFSYQLISSGANLTPTKSVIKEKEVVTLRIK